MKKLNYRLYLICIVRLNTFCRVSIFNTGKIDPRQVCKWVIGYIQMRPKTSMHR